MKSAERVGTLEQYHRSGRIRIFGVASTAPLWLLTKAEKKLVAGYVRGVGRDWPVLTL